MQIRWLDSHCVSHSPFVWYFTVSYFHSVKQFSSSTRICTIVFAFICRDHDSLPIWNIVPTVLTCPFWIPKKCGIQLISWIRKAKIKFSQLMERFTTLSDPLIHLIWMKMIVVCMKRDKSTVTLLLLVFS